MRSLHTHASRVAVVLAAAVSAAGPAAATGTHHHATHHRHVVGSAVRVAPVFAPPSPVEAGPLGLSGPRIPGLPGGGGVLGTGLSDGRGLLGIGFFGL